MNDAPDDPRNGGPEEEEPTPKGWIDPDDRLWRHPSEVARSAAAGAPRLAPRNHHRTRIMLAVAAVAAAAAAAWTGVLLSQDPTNPTSPSGVGDAASDAPLTTLAGATTPIPSVADAAGASMVALRAVTDHGTVDLVGVAVAEGGQVATTADQLSGLESIDMVGQGGKLRHASVVAIDHRSDIALVSVPDDVPVPRFSDDDRLTNGSADLTLTTASAANGAVTLRCTPGTITGIGAAIASGPAAGMPSITSSALSVSEGSGDLLLNSSGEVLGIYYGGAATATTTTTSALAPTFLPTELVVGVADDLRSSGQVTQGWLGIAGSDAVGQPGADVATVTPGSPAAGHLHSGDVIAELNSIPVRSMADLRGRLYVLTPSTSVSLSIQHGSSDQVVDVTLGASP